MKFTELKQAVYKDERLRKERITRAQLNLVVSVFCEKLFEALIMNDKVSIPNLFTLSLRKNKGKRIINPKTKEPMVTKDFYRVLVGQSTKLKDNLKEKASNEL